MPKPYSLDLRERVVGFVEDGHSRRGLAFASRRCGLSHAGWSSWTRLEPPPR
jgi:hypothetical protein